MRGVNELHLNEQTLIEAVQEWADKRMTVHAPRVTGISQENKGFEKTFVVKTDSRVPEGS